LFDDLVFANDINYVSKDELKKSEIVFCKIRYSDKATKAEIIEANKNEVIVKFYEPKSAVTPGQSLVIYDEMGYVLCGGIISKRKD